MNPKIQSVANFDAEAVASSVINFSAVVERTLIGMGQTPTMDTCLDKGLMMFIDYMVKLQTEREKNSYADALQGMELSDFLS